MLISAAMLGPRMASSYLDSIRTARTHTTDRKYASRQRHVDLVHSLQARCHALAVAAAAAGQPCTPPSAVLPLSARCGAHPRM